ncbi:hypothetical protein N7481_010593 [Penicillium waksmanii]|uniref:uncharacterized protein n=1 Tax=Penicillium waksmanii TaxID=69791 RepID=UPI00254693D6|nr:uncharacterized protein N7481_010593 [Penicillium waksmanii]KAJ5973383.1 hypothetical protein N7481_010593 [Penicillium waksmanii]
MAPAKMSLQADEELGKKDDDHRLPESGRFRPIKSSAIPRPRRIVIIIIVCVIVYQFFKHMPTDLTPAAERYNPTTTKSRPPRPASPGGSFQSPAVPINEKGKLFDGKILETHDNEEPYGDKIKFYNLAQSLPSQKYPKGQASNAVLFAGSSLHSISDLLPLACEMARTKLNGVHLVLLGRDEVSIEGIKQVNGISDSECPMTWHDGRPDSAAQSTDARMEWAVVDGLHFIWDFIAPEVIITQRQGWEDSFFWNGLEVQKAESGTPHIILPAPSRDLMWVASLRSHALQAWNDIQVDMVVHASQSSGALVRLVRSLDAADYLGSLPRLTIELPPLVESQLLESLQSLKLSQFQGQITLRRRVEPRYMDPADSSLRTVESFYPLNPSTTHLLLLSPQTELAPSFYHYLKYSVLRYNQPFRDRSASSNLLGISLELPRSKPSPDNAPFTPPPPPPFNDGKYQKKEHIPSLLWQAPNSNAALYFGDKWVEFHSFLSSRLDSEGRANAASKHKLVSKKYPAFMEYLLEMMQDKGYYMIYPSFSSGTTSPLATVHTELNRLPEEFTESINSAQLGEGSHEKAGGNNPDPEVAEFDQLEASSDEKPVSRETSITSLLGTFELGLPDVDTLPFLSYDGSVLAAEEHITKARTFIGRS